MIGAAIGKDRAFSHWWYDRSPANLTELRRQQRRNEIERIKFQGSLALLVFAVSSSALLLVRDMKERFKLT